MSDLDPPGDGTWATFAMHVAIERDALEDRLEQMTRERDEARAQLAASDTGAPCDGHRHCCADRRKLADELLRVRAERDALRASLARAMT